VTVFACLLALATAGATQPAPPDAASVAASVVRALDAQLRGVIAFRLRYTFEERGPGHDKTAAVDSMRLLKDGELIAVRLLREVQNGKTVSATDLANDQAKVDKQLPTDDYRLPITPDALKEYQFAYSQAPCDACPAGSVQIAFTSLKRDTDHGDGIAVVDRATYRIVRLDFHPSALPAHADSGTIAMQFGAVLPDLWDVTETTQHYTGHMLVFTGWGHVVQTYDEYRRFASVEEGTKALAAAVP